MPSDTLHNSKKENCVIHLQHSYWFFLLYFFGFFFKSFSSLSFFFYQSISEGCFYCHLLYVITHFTMTLMGAKEKIYMSFNF